MPVRNEAWVLGLSARAALRWCDALVVLLHACTDKSPEIMAQIERENDPGRVLLMETEDQRWDEMDHRQAMLNLAVENAATHIAMIDADEVLTADLIRNEMEGARSLLYRLKPGQMLELPGYNLRNDLHTYHSNGIWGNRWFATAFLDQEEACWRGDGFHHREPFGVNWRPWRPLAQGFGGVMHLWGANVRRLRAKHALYKVTERIKFPQKPVSEIDELYNLWCSPEDGPAHLNDRWEFRMVPDVWWDGYKDLMVYLDLDAEPWQEQEARRLVALHGRSEFKGLDLFGVV